MIGAVIIKPALVEALVEGRPFVDVVAARVAVVAVVVVASLLTRAWSAIQNAPLVKPPTACSSSVPSPLIKRKRKKDVLFPRSLTVQSYEVCVVFTANISKCTSQLLAGDDHTQQPVWIPKDVVGNKEQVGFGVC
jgi:hypothetical protein